ncbi:MAG: NADPH-dependent 7-cyano-7-deazaguanine reductase QueF [Fibrobacteres bacterium]|nr:NADPH-dependent 7-cyano-7-deazaguanine reductase QueF [Fibrobacterota bacterium]
MQKPKLTLLGKVTEYPNHPDKAKLEPIPFKQQKSRLTVTLESDEFTSLCPVTSQPDFGTIRIEFIPDRYIVESKSLKLYLYSFRNIGVFQEEIVQRIHNDLQKTLKPKYLKVTGYFKPRGSISITPVAESGKITPLP